MALQLANIEDLDKKGHDLSCEVGDQTGLTLRFGLRKEEGHFITREIYALGFASRQKEFREFLLNSYRFMYTKKPVSFTLTAAENVELRIDLLATGENDQDVQMLVTVEHHSYCLNFPTNEYGSMVLKIDDYYRK